ncbi:MAG: MFS transporter [Candidatus Bathyarchaeia archaeon]
MLKHPLIFVFHLVIIMKIDAFLSLWGWLFLLTELDGSAKALCDQRCSQNLCSQFFNMVGMSIVSPILPIYATSFGVSYAVASLVISVYAFGRLIADILVGAAADRWGCGTLCWLGRLSLLMALTNIFFASASIYWVLVRLPYF